MDPENWDQLRQPDVVRPLGILVKRMVDFPQHRKVPAGPVVASLGPFGLTIDRIQPLEQIKTHRNPDCAAALDGRQVIVHGLAQRYLGPEPNT